MISNSARASGEEVANQDIVDRPMGIKRLASTEVNPGLNKKVTPQLIPMETDDREFAVSPLPSQNVTQSDVSQPNSQQTLVAQSAVSKNKRPKKSKPELDEYYEPLKQVFQQKQFILNFEEFKLFMKTVKGNDTPTKVAYQFTADIPQLINLLVEVYPLVGNRALRERCKRLSVSLAKGKRVTSISDLTSEFSD